MLYAALCMVVQYFWPHGRVGSQSWRLASQNTTSQQPAATIHTACGAQKAPGETSETATTICFFVFKFCSYHTYLQRSHPTLRGKINIVSIFIAIMKRSLNFRTKWASTAASTSTSTLKHVSFRVGRQRYDVYQVLSRRSCSADLQHRLLGGPGCPRVVATRYRYHLPRQVPPVNTS